ncbi:MAG: SOS response-associated peptidase [Oscillospiraceae bacterium]|nr:SOS response-associated peptidase [Oscillospiraceae bacterium]
MCGRYLLEDDTYEEDLVKLNAPGALLNIARGEIFPTNTAPLITRDGIAAAKWGFPHWKNASVIINARAESALEKTMFRKPLLERRCIVPSNGFYEWDRTGSKKKKDKYLLRMPETDVLFMAAMINIFKDADGSAYSAFVILTTAASDTVAGIHDRMPVIVMPDELDSWINDANFLDFALHRSGPELELIPAVT